MDHARDAQPRLLLVRCAVLLGLLLTHRSAQADPPPAQAQSNSTPPTSTPAAETSPKTRHRLEWNERWHRIRPIEYVTTAVTGIASIGVFYFVRASDRPKWVGPILFDTAVRNALRLHTRSGLQAADNASTTLAYILPAQPVFDSVILPAVAGNFDLMWQLGVMDIQSYALSGLITASVYDTTGRARPSYAECKAGTSVDPMCSAGDFASFPSGHMALAMTSAGLLCAHHGMLPLYGGGAADVAACVEGVVLATGVGVLRLMGDRHYASDVLTGSAIGFLAGYAVPRLLHYWPRPISEVVSNDSLHMAILPGDGHIPLGLQVIGIF